MTNLFSLEKRGKGHVLQAFKVIKGFNNLMTYIWIESSVFTSGNDYKLVGKSFTSYEAK